MTVGDSLSTVNAIGTDERRTSQVRGAGETAGLFSSASDNAEHNRLVKAAVDFEALLISQMLKSTHEEGGGWLGTGEDNASSSALQMADEQFGKALAEQGGLGLAKFVVSEFRDK
jgi:Rod binding domain-containing protein